MKPITWMYVGAVILILMAACGLGVGGFIYLGSLGMTGNQGTYANIAGVLSCLGLIAGLGGIVLIFQAVRKTKADTAQNVTLKVDLPGEMNVEKMKCQSCGGVLSSDDIKIINGAPMVTCPFCKTVYQLTEEPKW
jgi:hypothetical protein